jgi:hypothetical protein
MMAENLVNYSTINIMYTQISLAERLQYAVMSEEEIIDATLSQVQTLTDVYAQAGIDVISIDKVTVDFLGEEHFAIKTTAEIEGYPYYILQVQDFQAGAYGITVTLSCLFEDTTDDLLGLFYAVE